MADAYIGEIRIFAGNYAPSGWYFCNGQELSIPANNMLYAVIGNTYGGNGTSTFKLPNLQGQIPMGAGTGTGLTPRTIGESVGEATVTLLESQIPAHTHTPQGYNNGGSTPDPTGALFAEAPPVGTQQTQARMFYPTANVPVSPDALQPTGGNQPHNNMQPFLAMNFIICYEGGQFPVKSS